MRRDETRGCKSAGARLYSLDLLKASRPVGSIVSVALGTRDSHGCTNS